MELNTHKTKIISFTHKTSSNHFNYCVSYVPILCTDFIKDLGVNLQGNGPVCQVKTLPEILHVYRAYPVMTVHKILTADTW
jgi:hypothetical protein